jgi:hypothetical protein
MRELRFIVYGKKLLLISSCNSSAPSMGRVLGHLGRIDQIRVETDLNPRNLYFNQYKTHKIFIIFYFYIKSPKKISIITKIKLFEQTSLFIYLFIYLFSHI